MKKYIVFFTLILSVLFVGFILFNKQAYKKDNLTTLVYKTETGFGYSISYNSKVLIKQDYIPTIQKNKSFCNGIDAQNVAYLVKEKLSKNENPQISLQELHKLNIQVNCLN